MGRQAGKQTDTQMLVYSVSNLYLPNLFLFFILPVVCVDEMVTCVPVHAWRRTEDTFVERVLYFHPHTGSGDQIQLTRLVHKHLRPLSLLAAAPNLFFFF